MTQPTDETIRAEFTKRAEQFGHHHHGGHGSSGGASIQRMVEAALLTGTERVLDLATGGGAVAAAFAHGAAEVIGIDMTPAMIRKAEERRREEQLTNVRFETGNVTSLPYEADSFDIATCRMSLHHFVEAEAVIAQAARVLKPGGRLMIVETLGSPDPDTHRRLDEVDRLRNASIVHVYSAEELKRLFERQGLRLQEVIEISRPIRFSRWVGATPEDVVPEIRRRVETEPLGIAVRPLPDGDLELTLPDALLIAVKPE